LFLQTQRCFELVAVATNRSSRYGMQQLRRRLRHVNDERVVAERL
jgi:hypothetical protein